jgi:hypothetical protein
MSKEPAAKGGALRLIRDWHGYLSAAAFMVILFFAVTGVLLNHPNLFPGPGVPYREKVYFLPPADLAKVNAAEDKERAFYDIVARDMDVGGPFVAGSMMSGALVVRTEGVKGTGDLELNLSTGQTQVNVSKHNWVYVMNGLHRGETAGIPWKIVLDVAAGLMIVMSIAGYALFFLMRFRLRTALALSALSLAGFGAAFAFLAR